MLDLPFIQDVLQRVQINDDKFNKECIEASPFIKVHCIYILLMRC